MILKNEYFLPAIMVIDEKKKDEGYNVRE